MLRHKLISICILVYFMALHSLAGQQNEPIVLELTLNQAIELAKQQSIQSFKNKNMYLTKYWAFRSYKGSRKPSLNLDISPFSYMSNYQFNDYDNEYNYQQRLVSNGSLSVDQNIVISGGTLSLSSDLTRIHDYTIDSTSFGSAPLFLSYTQPLSGYNSFRWQSRIEPLKFAIAKKELLQDLEGLSIQTNQYFFNLVGAEINLSIAKTNYHNADTLFRIAKGRFEIGTVTQDELLDFELGLLNSKISLTRSELNLKQAQIILNSFLGMDEKTILKCIVPNVIPETDIDVNKAWSLALENNPNFLDFERRLLVAKQNVAFEKSSSGFTAGMRAGYGVSQSSGLFRDVYKKPYAGNESVSMSLSFPIIDWGKRKGLIQVAKAELAVTEAEVKQARIDFERNVFQQVMEYNFQDEQVAISAKADTVAQLGYEVTKQRFLIDKVDVIKLNSARNSVDAARRNYISALQQFWEYYFTIRQVTLFDFERNTPLTTDFDKLLEK